MKVLILTNGYPDNDGSFSRMFVHVRSLFYKKQGLNFDVLNFQTQKPYAIDGVNVIPLSMYRDGEYDIAIIHSANVKNHYLFLRKHSDDFKRLIFFFHGFEICRMNIDYPKPYDYMEKNKLTYYARNVYDEYKLYVTRRCLKRLCEKSDCVFVSNYLFNVFKRNVGESVVPEDKVHIINNSVGEDFIKNTYDPMSEKMFDFITIRSNLDGSQYGIDLVCELAIENPKYNFLILGNGHYFEHNEIPQNVTYIKGNFSHEEIINYLNQARCGLMPTRQDTQGVMSCEMAAFGIPLITSDIEVCREVFEGCVNVRLIDNAEKIIDSNLYELIRKGSVMKSNKWNSENTMEKEIRLIYSIRDRA